MEEEFTVAVYQKNKVFAFKGYKDGTELFSDAIHLAKKFTREKAEMLKALDDEAKAEGEVVIPDDSEAVTE